MTTTEKTLSVSIVPGPLFEQTRRTEWGIADDSRSVFCCWKYPLLIDGSKSYAEQLANLVRPLLENRYYGELEAYPAIWDELTALVGEYAASEIVHLVSLRWEKVNREEAIDRAREWVSRHNLLEEIDRIQPDSMYCYFHKGTKSLEEAKDAVFLYGYELGLAAAQKEARI